MSEVILCSPLKDTMYTFETSPLSKTTQPSFHKAVALSVLEHNTCLQEILKARNPPNTICFPANEHNYNVYLRLHAGIFCLLVFLPLVVFSRTPEVMQMIK